MTETLVKSTGEIIEFKPSTLAEAMEAWLLCSDYEKSYKAAKDKLKPVVEAFVNSNGTSDVVNGYMFRVSNVQRYNYDKATLRRYLDEDTLDLLLEPNKTVTDKFLKDNLKELGDASTEIRAAMVPVGRPYTVVKAEKVER